MFFFFFQAEVGIRDPLWSRGLGDVYKEQVWKIGGADLASESAPKKCSLVGGSTARVEHSLVRGLGVIDRISNHPKSILLRAGLVVFRAISKNHRLCQSTLFVEPHIRLL